MALQDCHECGKQVSTQADKCPNCGAPVKKPISQQKIGCLGSILVIFLVFIVIGALMNNTTAPPPLTISDVQKPEDPELAKKKAERLQKIEADFLKSPAGKIWAKHKNWDRDVCKTIANRRIYIGMTSEQVRLAWGAPHKINTSSGSWGVHEQWVMHDSFDGDYLYFQNGVLTSMQRTK